MGQVQFLNIVGNVGRAKASDSLQTFSGGFDWAMFNVGLVYSEDDSVGTDGNQTNVDAVKNGSQTGSNQTTSEWKTLDRRKGKASKFQDSEEDTSGPAKPKICSVWMGGELIDRIITNFSILIIISIVRECVDRVIKWKWNADIDDLKFPSWFHLSLSSNPSTS